MGMRLQKDNSSLVLRKKQEDGVFGVTIITIERDLSRFGISESRNILQQTEAR
jgi:hypothetical protein